MVSGHLEVKKGYYYIVLNYVDENGKRHRPWFPTGLPEKGNKRKAESMLSKVRNSYEPPKVTEEGLRSDMLFADYLEQWLEVAKTRIAIATYSSYSNMVQSTIAPYFRKIPGCTVLAKNQ